MALVEQRLDGGPDLLIVTPLRRHGVDAGGDGAADVNVGAVAREVQAVSPINVLASSTRARAQISLYWGFTHF